MVSDSTKITDNHLYFDILIDGKREYGMVSKDGYRNILSTTSSKAAGPITGYTASIENENFGGLSIIRQGIVFNDHDSSIAQHNKIMLESFSPGFYSYATNPWLSKDIYISWNDDNGKNWSTLFGKQINGSFHIVKQIKHIDKKTGLVDYIIVDCIFHCTLYDMKGNKMELTNGRLLYYF